VVRNRDEGKDSGRSVFIETQFVRFGLGSKPSNAVRGNSRKVSIITEGFPFQGRLYDDFNIHVDRFICR